jgi:hypothetical protein
MTIMFLLVNLNDEGFKNYLSLYDIKAEEYEDWAAWICDKAESFGHGILCSCPWEVSGHEGKGFFSGKEVTAQRIRVKVRQL